MTALPPTATPTTASVRPVAPSTPLLSDEELDALIQAFNRRESVPLRPSTPWIWLTLLVLGFVTVGGWWWS
jgi:hypothetical protein